MPSRLFYVFLAFFMNFWPIYTVLILCLTPHKFNTRSMQINRANFLSQLPKIRDSIRTWSFFSLDFEMTGLLSSPILKSSGLDSVQSRYWKLKKNVEKFLPIQLGITGFELKGNSEVVAYPINLYIYPYTLYHNDQRTYLFQQSTINFLNSTSIDYNKLLYDAVLFTSFSGEKKIMQEKNRLENREKLRELNRIVSPDMLAFQAASKEIIESFIQSEQEEMLLNIRHIRYRAYTFLEKQLPVLFKGIALVVEYDSEHILQRSTMKIIKKRLDTPEGQPSTKQDSLADSLANADYSSLRTLLNEISELKIPLLTHNGLQDIMHLYEKFFFDLPLEQKKFKSQFKEKFPIVFDTKYMLNGSSVIGREVNLNTELMNSFQLLLKYKNMRPQVSIDREFGNYELNLEQSKKLSHEAGFDSLITGFIFFKSIELLNLSHELFYDRPELIRKLKFFSNKLPLQFLRQPFDLDDFDLSKSKGKLYELSYDGEESSSVFTDGIKKLLEEKLGNNIQIYRWEEGKLLIKSEDELNRLDSNISCLLNKNMILRALE